MKVTRFGSVDAGSIAVGGSGGFVGGDLSGPLSSPAVSGIQGYPVSTTPPVSGQVLEFNGTDYTPTTPGTTGPGTPALTLSTTNAAGSATTYVATDATVAAFDTTVPVTQALGDVAATGSAGKTARRDHRHGMPTAADIAAALGLAGWQHVHVGNVLFSGDGATTDFVLPSAPVDAYSVSVFVGGSRSQDWTLTGTFLDTLAFGSAPASGTDNIAVDITAVLV